MQNLYFFLMLPKVSVAIISWHERHHNVLHGMHSSLVAFCLAFRSSHWRCSIKNLFFKFLQYLQKNTSVESLFKFIKWDSNAIVLLKTYFKEHLQTTASESSASSDCLNCIYTMVCLNEAFLWNAINGTALNASSNVLLMLNIKCLIFGAWWGFTYVTENGITYHFRTVLLLFNRFDLFRMSTFLIWFIIVWL